MITVELLEVALVMSYLKRKAARALLRLAANNQIYQQKRLPLESFLFIITSSTTKQRKAVKQQEFVKWLREQGGKVTNGTDHLKVYYNGKQTTVPRHPGKEIDNQFAKRIAKQIGLELKLK